MFIVRPCLEMTRPNAESKDGKCCHANLSGMMIRSPMSGWSDSVEFLKLRILAASSDAMFDKSSWLSAPNVRTACFTWLVLGKKNSLRSGDLCKVLAHSLGICRV